MSKKSYLCLKEHYEDCFKNYGDTPEGVDWPNARDAATRYGVMLDLIRYDIHQKASPTELRLLDVGCGAGHFLEFLRNKKDLELQYIGLDISETFVSHCRKKFPDHEFLVGDLLSDGFRAPISDYSILNGVFTEKRGMDEDTMFDFFTGMLVNVFSASERGIAFNVMSKNVDWERDDLFHLSIDKLTHFLTKNLSRHFVIRNDYGLYEYTTYLYK